MKSTVSIEDLPDPIIEYILSYLSPYRDLKQCMQVNKSWYRFVYDVIRKTQRDFYNAVCHMSVQWCHLEAEPGPTITKRYSHSACCSGNSMYIFGGCTTANTTFNDLWRFDLGSRCWIRPLATGTYPPPKACATLVSHSDNLVLFGGWTHTAPYPLHQVWRVFNQIHIYNTTTNRWTQITPPTTCPPMAGHSATVHGDVMVVFGGVQKQICDGPFVSTSDVWTLDLKSYKWQKQVTSTDPPPPRYGHSQIPIDKDHLLIMGGCGGPNMLYTDIWLLKMINGPGGLWEWQKMDVRCKENSAPQIAFHPACKVGSQVVVMSKSHKSRSSPASLPNLLRAPSRTWVPPRMDDEDSYPTLHKFSRTMKRPMCLYVLDISTVFDGFVTWRAVKNQSPSAPEEIILYSLVLGKGEVIMFGGIQKDLNSSEQEGETVPEIVSNSLHFMTAERFVI
ncbi:unnamed protein product [Larinioides sclopetarius]|uniref:F-box domain-containing protein n=1 Tax=Larinioides sclopetarius TaxID=280406 RepID=A0AAV2BZ98_9ARAC